jgi:hypothetical protein
VPEQPIPLGRPRSEADGCRRYRPIQVTYDTRNIVLDLEIEEEWDSRTKALWEENKEMVQAGLLAELGSTDSDAKLDNYRAMGPAPWSVVFEHTVLLKQVRSSFAHGDFYPALVGACALGERLLHQLVLALRGDFVNHAATTKRVRSGRLGNEWSTLIDVLQGWAVFDGETADVYRELEQRRHAAVHFDPSLSAAGRESALAALLALQQIVERVFEPHGGPPRYITGTPGISYLTLAAEQEPLIRRIFLPNCALVSPANRLEADDSAPGGWCIYDDPDYPCDPLTDEQFAERLGDVQTTRP